MSAPSWRDPRLLLGIALVLGSVVLGARVVGQASDTVGVYALTRSVGAGQPVTAADLRVVQVRLDDATLRTYVAAGADLSAGAVALRGLGGGELLPLSSVGRVGDLTARPVTVPLGGNVPQGVAVGALVDVWVVPATEVGTDAGDPVRLVEAAEVSAVVEGGGALGTGRGADVQVVVPEGAMPTVLQAVSADDDLVLVPVPGGRS
ncbi:hypothetical protein [Kineococcus sp. SYSU DK003]|uniref:hypothetical protein n=1 Tax=Kineococcus sp. SYSU DK003 TaxID=3383124 RepID=UPI003D7CF356